MIHFLRPIRRTYFFLALRSGSVITIGGGTTSEATCIVGTWNESSINNKIIPRRLFILFVCLERLFIISKFFIRLDNVLHQLVSHDVRFVEIDEGYSFDSL